MSGSAIGGVSGGVPRYDLRPTFCGYREKIMNEYIDRIAFFPSRAKYTVNLEQ